MEITQKEMEVLKALLIYGGGIWRSEIELRGYMGDKETCEIISEPYKIVISISPETLEAIRSLKKKGLVETKVETSPTSPWTAALDGFIITPKLLKKTKRGWRRIEGYPIYHFKAITDEIVPYFMFTPEEGEKWFQEFLEKRKIKVKEE